LTFKFASFSSLNSTLDSIKGAPKYAPPYDSPIENDFAYQIVKYLKNNVQFEKQVSVDTKCGCFRLDFTASHLGRCIGLECDGKEFHCSTRDTWRDALLLKTGVIEVIYRFPGKDLAHNINDCLFILSACEPQLFSERGLENLKILASWEVKEKIGQKQVNDNTEWIFCGYKKFQNQSGISVYRHHHGNSFLLEKSAFAEKHEGRNIDFLLEKFDSEKFEMFNS